MSNVAGELVVPKLNPEAVKVFLAEDDERKRDAIVSSLGDFGLDHSLTIATTYEEAEAYVIAQEPHALTANVFLFDGGLDSDNSRALWHGSTLAAQLFSKYIQPLKAVTDKAAEELKELGLTRNQVSTIFDYKVASAVHEVARRQLQSEALLAGVSRVRDGEIGDVAQFPWTPYAEVGKTVFDSVIPNAVRKKIAKQQRMEEQRARSREQAPQEQV